MLKKLFLTITYMGLFFLVGCNWQSVRRSQELPMDTITFTNPPMVTFSPMPSTSPAPTNTLSPSSTPTPNIWQVRECLYYPSVISLDKDWLWRYTGDINDGQGYLEMLLQFPSKYKLQGFVFDHENAREYTVNGCINERSFIMWLSEENTVKFVIHGEFPIYDPRQSKQNELSGDVLTGTLTNRASLQTLPIYLKLSSGTAGTVSHRFQLAGIKNDAVIFNASRLFVTSIMNNEREKVVQMIQFPINVSYGGKSMQISNQEVFLERYDDIFHKDFTSRLALTFPNDLIAYAGNFIGTIGQSIYGGGTIYYNEYGKVIGLDTDNRPTATPIPLSTTQPISNSIDTEIPLTPTLHPECGTVKLGIPGTQSQDTSHKIIVQGTAILCASVSTESGYFEPIPILEGTFDLDKGSTEMSENADIEFSASGGRMIFYYVYPINDAFGIQWSLQVGTQKAQYPPEPTFDDCYNLSNTYSGDNETAYLCVWTGANNLSRVKVEEWNPLDNQTLAIKISFITWHP